MRVGVLECHRDVVGPGSATRHDLDGPVTRGEEPELSPGVVDHGQEERTGQVLVTVAAGSPDDGEARGCHGDTPEP